MEQVNAGMRSRRQNRPFLPSPGQFVARCREEASVTAGLPNASELVDMGLRVLPESVGCIRMQSLIRGNQTRTTGWLPTCIQNMRANALTDAELRRKAADELSCMTHELTVVRLYLNQ